MNLKFSSILLVSLIIFSASFAYSQNRPDDQSIDVRLPSPKGVVSCGLAIRYADDALAKANYHKSNIIFILKMKNPKDINLARIRTKNIRAYSQIRRGFENSEVAVDLTPTDEERVEIHVGGELLYSLPIKKKDKLEFAIC